MPYATAIEIKQAGKQLSGFSDDYLDAVIEQCSRFFDHLCGVTDQFFEPTVNTASARTFYGDGTNMLRVDPYVAGTLTVAVPDDYTVPTFAQRGGYLILTTEDVGAVVGMLPPFPSWWHTGAGWWAGLPITVTAKWGHAYTPADVKLAIIELVINVLRETDPANLNLMDLERQPLRERVPPRVKQVSEFYRAQQGVLV